MKMTKDPTQESDSSYVSSINYDSGHLFGLKASLFHPVCFAQGNLWEIVTIIFLCPFAIYYLRYIVRPLFTIPRIFLVSGTIK